MCKVTSSLGNALNFVVEVGEYHFKDRKDEGNSMIELGAVSIENDSKLGGKGQRSVLTAWRSRVSKWFKVGGRGI